MQSLHHLMSLLFISTVSFTHGSVRLVVVGWGPYHLLAGRVSLLRNAFLFVGKINPGHPNPRAGAHCITIQLVGAAISSPLRREKVHRMNVEFVALRNGSSNCFIDDE